MTQRQREQMESYAAGSLLALVGKNLPTNQVPERKKIDRLQAATIGESSVPMTTEDGSFSSQSSMASDQLDGATSPETQVKKNATKILFPTTLMTVLTDPSNADIIVFLPDNTAFTILQPEVFASSLMPKHFKIEKFTSFVRKLQRWGFERVKSRCGYDRNVFKHPLFRRGEWALCRKMKCLKEFPSRASIVSCSRTSSPTSSKHEDTQASAPNQIPSSIHIDEDKQKGDRLLIDDEELQNHLALSVILRDQVLSGQKSTHLPQEIVDKATTKVLGAAMEVLARDKENGHNVSYSSLSPSTPNVNESQMQNILLLSQLSARNNIHSFGMTGNDLIGPSMISGRNSFLGGMPQASTLMHTLSNRNSFPGGLSLSERGRLLLDRQRQMDIGYMGLY
mmetsp:Transcript_18745/g.24834  ORF Transcript_18745/g.24834 Transcript_18745/m.24834 type:complete len:394 (+) Transcript_18745:131-1312(+)